MVIITEYKGNQKKFHWYWLPLICKHQEVKFFVKASSDFIYPKDIKNLNVNQPVSGKGPTLICPIDKIPTYRAMEQLTKKDKNWKGTPEDLGERFYDA
tara:strand:- start:2529 stop:2822 length:294 start_codon:yes stop_codon:yes gene_type:complete